MKNWLSNCFKNVTNGIKHFDSIFENLFGSYNAEEVEAFNKRDEEEGSKNCFILFQRYFDSLLCDFLDNLTEALHKIFLSFDKEELENFNEEYEEECEETYEEDDDEKEVPLKWHDYVVMVIGTTIYFFVFLYIATL